MNFNNNEIAVYQKVFVDFKKWIKKYNGTIEDAEDCVNDAMISYMQKKHHLKFNTDKEIGGYVFRASQYIWNKQLKERGLIRDIPEEYIFSNYEDEDTPNYNLKEEICKIMEDCMKNLPEKGKDLIVGFYNQRKTMDDLAKDLGYSGPNSARTAKLKFMDKVRDCAKLKFEQLYA